MVNWFVFNAEAGPVRVGFHVNFAKKGNLMLSYLNTLPFLQGLSKSTWLIHGHPLKRSSKSWQVQDDHPPTEMSPGSSVSFVHFATGSASNEVFKRPFRRWSSWTLPTQVGSDQVTKRGNHPEYEAWGLWPKKKPFQGFRSFWGKMRLVKLRSEDEVTEHRGFFVAGKKYYW